MMDKGLSTIIIGMVTVFFAVFMLFYVFDSLNKSYTQCQEGAESSLCGGLNSFSFSIIVILLIIGGFVVVIAATAYILISSA